MSFVWTPSPNPNEGMKKRLSTKYSIATYLSIFVLQF